MESNVQGKQKAPALGDATGARNTGCDTHIHICSCASTPPQHLGLDTTATSEQRPSLRVGFSSFQGAVSGHGSSSEPPPQVLEPIPPLVCSSSIPRAECLPGPAVGSGLHPSPSPLTFSSSLYRGLMVLRLMVVLRFPCRDLSGRR